MHHIIYLSRATTPLPEHALTALLEKSRWHNRQQHITGALLYHQSQFVQLIEGEEGAVTALYAQLLRDPRHGGLLKVADKAIAERSFPSWDMAFHPRVPAQLRQVPGYKTPQELQFTAPNLRLTDAHLLTLLKELVLTSTAEAGG
jgi:hypothetical protein